MKIFFKILSVCVLFFISCATNPVTGKKEVRFFSDKDEIEFGKEVYKSVVKEYGLYNNPQAQALVENIGKRIVSNAERKLPYSFTLLNTDMVNAFAAPGGYIFVTKGLLEYVENEDELACVLGHELAHITLRHSMKALEKQYGYEIVFNIVSALSERDLSLIKQYTDTITGLILLGYGRDNEFDADFHGIRYAKLAGYNPNSMISFFGKLRKMEGKKLSKLETLFSSHPPTDERIKRVQDAISKGRI